MNITVFDGGDKRFVYLKQMLENAGHTVCGKGISECVVLPLPLNEKSRGRWDFIDELSGQELCGVTVFGGCICEDLSDTLEKKGARVIDYMQSESLLRYNAALTVEAAIAEGARRSQRGYVNSHCLITGFGRLGSRLCRALRALDAHITVAVRNHGKFSSIESCGAVACDIYDLPPLKEFDFIFNTADGVVITCPVAENCTAVELASQNGFADMSNVCIARGLPGKYSPLSASEAIYKTISEHLKGETK